MERETGFEPATTCLEGRSSSQLSYSRSLWTRYLNLDAAASGDCLAGRRSRLLKALCQRHEQARPVASETSKPAVLSPNPLAVNNYGGGDMSYQDARNDQYVTRRDEVVVERDGTGLGTILGIILAIVVVLAIVWFFFLGGMNNGNRTPTATTRRTRTRSSSRCRPTTRRATKL